MEPVSIALLSTLLPTCVLILMLSFLCSYLYQHRNRSPQEILVQLDEERAKFQHVEQAELIDLHARVRVSIPTGWPGVCLLGRELLLQLPDFSHPDLIKEMGIIVCHWARLVPLDYEEERYWTTHLHLCERPQDRKQANNVSRVREILELLGYRGIPVAVIVKLLQRPETREDIIDHILVTCVVDKTALNNDQQTSLLPPADVHGDIITYIKAIRGVQFSRSATTIVNKILPPNEEDVCSGDNFKMPDWPTENRDKTVELILRLLYPYRNEHHMPPDEKNGGFIFHTSDFEKKLDSFVYGRFLMQTSPQGLEFSWPETSETCFATEPDIFATAGDDGVLLDEPVLWRKGNVVTIPIEDLT